MADKVKATIISRDEAVVGDLLQKLGSLAEVEAIVRGAKGAYHQIREQAPRLLFVDIRDDRETKFALVDRVARFLPDTLVFILHDVKDPDLILRSLRTGVADFILFPAENNNFVATVRLALEKGAKGEREGEIIVISSNKGGQGVTMLSVNLADHIYALTGGRVLIVDLKLQTGNVALFLDMKGNYTVVDLIRDMARLDESFISSSLIRHARGFHALPAPEEIEKAKTVTPEAIKRMFRTLKEYMDYIIVDIAAEFSEQTASVIDLAEKILLVGQQSVPSLKGIRETLDLFKNVGYKEDKVKVVINRYEKRNDIKVEDIEKLFEQRVFATVSNDFRAVTAAINKGEVLNAGHAGSPVDEDIAVLATLLTGIQRRNTGRSRRGFLERLIRGKRKPSVRKGG